MRYSRVLALVLQIAADRDAGMMQHSIGTIDSTDFDEQNSESQNQLLKIVRDITSKGFVRNNYKKNLVDLSDVKLSLKGKK